MLLALQKAAQGRYQTYTNPMVGAAIVKNGQLLATGYHHRYGEKHAERDAISKLTPEQVFGSTLYVTLEPCNHYGKQPPCTQLIIASHIQRVVVAQPDPHSIVAGKGISCLRAAGINVDVGLLKDKVEKLNEHYNYFYQYQRPFIAVKQAISLDNRVAFKQRRTPITNPEVNELVHRERANFQAILVGSSTALIDNPTLLTSVKSAHPPIRIVLDRRGRLMQQPQLNLLTNAAAPTWILTQSQQEKAALPQHVRLWQLPQLQPVNVCHFLAEQGVQSVYIEGGPSVATSFINQGLVNEIITYIAPKFLGKNGTASWLSSSPFSLQNVEIRKIANNVRISGKVAKCSLV